MSEMRKCENCIELKKGDCAGFRNPSICNEYKFAGTIDKNWPAHMQGGNSPKTNQTIEEMRNAKRHL